MSRNWLNSFFVSINPREPAEPVINHAKIAGRLALAGLPNPGARQRDLAIPPEGNMEVILGRRLTVLLSSLAVLQ